MLHMRCTRALLEVVALLLGTCGGSLVLGACGGGSSSPPSFEITSGTPPNGATGVTYPGFTFSASNGVVPINWSESGVLPPGMSLNTSGQLLGTPVSAGTFSFVVTASDSSNPPRTATTTVDLLISDSLILISTNPQPPSATATYPYAGFVFMVSSGGTPPFTWAVSAGTLPPGLMLGTDGTLSGLPTNSGPFGFTVAATDSAPTPQTQSAPFTLTVNTPTAPVVSTTPAPPSGTITYPYASYQFAASGGYAPYTWAVTTGAVPAGLTLSADGVLSGTPGVAGTVMFTVTATDSATPPEAGQQSFAITVNTPAPPVINTSPAPPAGIGDQSYPGYTFTATGGYLPLTWAVTANVLPPGIALGSDGSLTGTPTTVGSFPFTVTVTDSAPTPEMNSAPFEIDIATPPPPTIDVPTLPTGIVGTAYATISFIAANGLLPLVWTETGALPVGLELSPAGVLSGTPQNDGEFPITLNVTDALGRNAPGVPLTVRVSLARPAAAFTLLTASMTIPRSAHTATLLLNDQVLITGGTGPGGVLTSAELYNPANQTFTATTSSLTVGRSGHTATLLTNTALPDYGFVLLAGGGDQSAELYDPTAGTFTATGSMVGPHSGQTATLLQNGQVLVAGGGTASAELFNPATGTFTATGSMSISRTGHTATLLLNGQVLIAGGESQTAELYDPVAGQFTLTGSMSENRTGHTATLLANAAAPNYGMVLIAGPDVSAEVFNATPGTFSLVGNLLGAATAATANLLNDGTVLIAGGYGIFPLGILENRGIDRPVCVPSRALGVPLSLALTDLFAPESEGFNGTGLLQTARYRHTATLLADGTVLVTGGTFAGRHFEGNCPVSAVDTLLSSAELYQ